MSNLFKKVSFGSHDLSPFTRKAFKSFLSGLSRKSEWPSDGLKIHGEGLTEKPFSKLKIALKKYHPKTPITISFKDSTLCPKSLEALLKLHRDPKINLNLDLSDARLVGDFEQFDLSNITFVRTDLRGADLLEADLHGVFG